MILYMTWLTISALCGGYHDVLAIFTEPVENGMLLKEYRCVYAFQVNYGKPSDCNKIIRSYFNESFYF